MSEVQLQRQLNQLPRQSTTASSSPTMTESVWALVGVGLSFVVIVAVIVFIFYKTTRSQWTRYDTGNIDFTEDNNEIIQAELQSQSPTVQIVFDSRCPTVLRVPLRSS